jgi:hypothetical protein
VAGGDGETLHAQTLPPLSLRRHLVYGGAWGLGIGLWLALNYFVGLITMFLFALWPICFKWVSRITTGPWHTFRLFWSEYARIFEADFHPFPPASTVFLYATVIGTLLGMLLACLSRMFLLDPRRRVTVCSIWALRAMVRRPIAWVLACMPLVILPLYHVLDRWWLEYVFAVPAFLGLILLEFILLQKEVALGTGKNETWRPRWIGWRTVGLLLLLLICPAVPVGLSWCRTLLSILLEFEVFPMRHEYQVIFVDHYVLRPAVTVFESPSYLYSWIGGILMYALFLVRARDFAELMRTARFILQWDVLRSFLLKNIKVALVFIAVVAPFFVHMGVLGYMGYMLDLRPPGVPDWLTTSYSWLTDVFRSSFLLNVLLLSFPFLIFDLLVSARLFARLG